MSTQNLSGYRIAILAVDGFEQPELVQPKQAFEDAGAKTAVISEKSGKIQGMNHADKGDTVKVDATFADAQASDFDAVLLPGGALNADKLRVVKEAQKFIAAIDAAGKPVAVICHAPWLLISAGLAKGRKLTSYHTIQDDLRNAGADWVDREVVRDRNWISSRQPQDIPAFNREAIKVFTEANDRAGHRAAAKTAHS